MYFFFQAEDGIRDYKVTGVQTCALPILTVVWGTLLSMLIGRSPLSRRAPHQRCGLLLVAKILSARHSIIRNPPLFRSEERRVGKECGARWSMSQYKKNTYRST